MVQLLTLCFVSTDHQDTAAPGQPDRFCNKQIQAATEEDEEDEEEEENSTAGSAKGKTEENRRGSD